MVTSPTQGEHAQPDALHTIARYKIGYATDDWGMRSSTPSGIPDHAGAWVRYKDHIAALVEAQQPAPSAAAAGEVPLPLLVRDIAADLGTTPIQVCTALAQLGFGGHSVNMAVTPRMAKSLRAHFASPTPQADSAQDEPLQAFDSPRAKALMRAWEEGWAACRDAEYVGEEAQNDAFNSSHTLTLCIAEDQQLTAPQADSQPAPQGETNAQLDIDSNSSAPGQQRDVAGSVALGQPVGNGSDQAAGHTGAQGDKLLIVAERNIRSFLRSAVFKSESDREAALNCVDVLWEAARAPADSVTAPEGGVTAVPVKQCPGIPRPGCNYLAQCESVCNKCGKLHSTRFLEDSQPVAAARRWNTYEEAIADPVFQTARSIMGTENIGQDRQLVKAINHVIDSTQPAQAADSVLEDAARLAKIMQAIRDYHFALDNREHGGVAMARAWNAICDVLNMDWVQGAESAARKQGANHD